LNAIAELNDLADRSLLIVEDDKPFLERLSRAMETRGFAVTLCDTVSDGLAQINKAAPAFAVVDLRLGDGNGLDVVSALKRKRPDARTIVLTGYGNIATAVTAVKMGAVDYLSKPADADDVVAALLASGTEKSELPSNPMSADRVRWEHIQRIYEMCNRNVSETARRLNMHRRTLQRILAKRAPRLVRSCSPDDLFLMVRRRDPGVSNHEARLVASSFETRCALLRMRIGRRHSS
jgi:two-component system response regulator RegA